MCTLPTFPMLPTFTIDPCSLSTGGQVSCPIIFPDFVGLPAWGVQVVLWVLVYVPLAGLSCFLFSTATLIENGLFGVVTALQNGLLTLFTTLGSLFVWAGPWAPILGALVLSGWLVIVVVVVLVLVNVGEDVAKVAIEA